MIVTTVTSSYRNEKFTTCIAYIYPDGGMRATI
jgi:hypothetical protein